MSWRKKVMIYCDVPGCLELVDSAKERSRPARKQVRAWGWESKGNVDICPQHAGRPEMRKAAGWPS